MVHNVNDNTCSSTDEEELFIGMVKADGYVNADEWSAQLKINGKNLNFKLDTGADCNVIRRKCLSILDQTKSYGNVNLSCLPKAKGKCLSKAKSFLTTKESVTC